MWGKPGVLIPNKIYRYPTVGMISEYLLKDHNVKNYNIEKRFGKFDKISIITIPMELPLNDYSVYVNKAFDGTSTIIPHYILNFNATWRLLEDNDKWFNKGVAIDKNTICVGIVSSDGLVPTMYKAVPFECGAKLVSYILYSNKMPFDVKSIEFIRGKNRPGYVIENSKEFLKKVKANYKKLGGKV